MQNISWNLFSATGNIDAYLLYKDYQRVTVPGEDDAELSMDVEENEG
ncbi:MAG TPA: YqzL family protein [Bacillota bacterium]|nr:YqzL family protein [Bacillota bacterium]